MASRILVVIAACSILHQDGSFAVAATGQMESNNLVFGRQQQGYQTRRLPQRKMQGDDVQSSSLAEQSSECQEENQILIDFNLLGENDDIWHLLYEGQKNISASYTCNDDICDFSNVLEQMQPVCELLGGQPYAISGNTTLCSNETFGEVNYPVCWGRSCANDFVERLDLTFCESATYDTHVFNRTMNDVCALDMQRLWHGDDDDDDDVPNLCDTGIGDPDYVFNCLDDWNTYCVPTSGSSFECDFSPAHADIQVLCEEQGGYLYGTTDTYNSTSSNTETGAFINFESYTFLLTPICIAASCDGPKYIEELLVPYFDYFLQGTFDQPAFEGENTTLLGTYDFIEYAAISNVPPSVNNNAGEDSGENEESAADPETTSNAAFHLFRTAKTVLGLAAFHTVMHALILQ